MQAPRYKVNYYSISEVIKERQRNWRLNSFHENMGKEIINYQSERQQVRDVVVNGRRACNPGLFRRVLQVFQPSVTDILNFLLAD
jgi:hypothetical protein